MRIVLLNAVKYRFLTTAVFLFTSATWGETTIDSSEVKRDLDWVDRQEMDAEQQAKIPRFCCGAFLEPQSIVQKEYSFLPTTMYSTDYGWG